MSGNNILTTHVGSLPRPVALLDAMKARLAGEPIDEADYEKALSAAVSETVAMQAACGIDIVTDGEMSKPGFFTYVQERLTGFEPRPGEGRPVFAAERAAFPEYYEDYFARAMTGGAVAPVVPMFCTGPIAYRGEAAAARDIANLRAALEGVSRDGAFLPSIAPSGLGHNDYYATEEEFFDAAGEALRTEYLAIVDAGFQLQIDDPFLSDIFVEPGLDEAAMDRRATLYVEAINHALRGIPPEKIRFHTCYGINEGPRIHEAPMARVAPFMLRIDAGAYSFEAGNPRHEHEYHVWEDIDLPDGRKIIPGVITHASNIVEHPELIAERLVRFAERVGRENVIAGADCGFSSQACYHTEVHPTVIRAKFEALAEGARLASERLG
ncbi:MAG: cobalamin-independent methionine synthase II family protein [Rhodospirillaceae bacterium]